MRIKLFEEYNGHPDFSKFNQISDHEFGDAMDQKWLKLTDYEYNRISNIISLEEGDNNSFYYWHDFDNNLIQIFKIDDDYYYLLYRYDIIKPNSETIYSYFKCDQLSELLRLIKFIKKNEED